MKTKPTHKYFLKSHNVHIFTSLKPTTNTVYSEFVHEIIIHYK